MNKFICVILFQLSFCLSDYSQKRIVAGESSSSPVCRYWQSKVDEKIRLPRNLHINESKERNIFAGINCLLMLKGNAKPTSYSAVKNLKLIEADLPQPTMEIAALYKISEIFYQKWDPEEAIVLVDKSRKQNTREAIEAAYKSYSDWFEKLKEIGVKEARKQKLDPLVGSGVNWY